MRRCVFFDRDGIVNRTTPSGYVTRWGEFELLPSFPAVCGAALALGFEVVIVTNQRCVATGLVSAAEIEDIHRRMTELLLGGHGLRILDVCFCPHDDGQCDCRKPQPGMLLHAAAKHGLDLPASWMIGDQERDVEAGRRAGCRTVLVNQAPGGTRADVCVADLAQLEERITDLLQKPVGG